MVDITQIGNVLRDARLDTGLTQQVVADAIGLSVWSYNRLENGHRHFNPCWVAQLPRPVREPVVRFLATCYRRELAALREMMQSPAEPAEPSTWNWDDVQPDEPSDPPPKTGPQRGDQPTKVVGFRRGAPPAPPAKIGFRRGNAASI